MCVFVVHYGHYSVYLCLYRGRSSWREERKLNSDTFGEDGKRGSWRSRTGYRGRWGFRGRGGFVGTRQDRGGWGVVLLPPVCGWSVGVSAMNVPRDDALLGGLFLAHRLAEFQSSGDLVCPGVYGLVVWSDVHHSALLGILFHSVRFSCMLHMPYIYCMYGIVTYAVLNYTAFIQSAHFVLSRPM